MKIPLGIIGKVAKSVVGLYKWVTPFFYLSGSRVASHRKMYSMSEDDKLKEINKRMRRVDYYILSWVVIEIIISPLMPYLEGHCWLRFGVIILASVRILEIVGYNLNLVLFDAIDVANLRGKIDHSVASAVRTLVTTGLNYLELVTLFFVLYYVLGAEVYFDETRAAIPKIFYFSLLNQIGGWPENFKLSNLILLSGIQTLIGFGFSILIIARVVSLLPQIKSLDDNSNQSPPETT